MFDNTGAIPPTATIESVQLVVDLDAVGMKMTEAFFYVGAFAFVTLVGADTDDFTGAGSVFERRDDVEPSARRRRGPTTTCSAIPTVPARPASRVGGGAGDWRHDVTSRDASLRAELHSPGRGVERRRAGGADALDDAIRLRGRWQSASVSSASGG